jgi:hypothetical protein
MVSSGRMGAGMMETYSICSEAGKDKDRDWKIVIIASHIFD